MPQVTVIIPTYNRSDLLPRAIASVLHGGWSDLEVIVCDDGSTDDAPSVVERLQKKAPGRIRRLRLDHSGLPAAARNRGCEAARGEFVAFLDSDDVWLPGKLERQVGVLQDNPSIGLVSTNAFRVRAGSETRCDEEFFIDNTRRCDGQRRNRFDFQELLQENFVITSTAVLRRSVLSETGLFCEDPRLKAVEDWDLWLRVAATSGVAYLDEPLAVYRDAPEMSVRRGQTPFRYWRAISLVCRRIRTFLHARGSTTRELRKALAEATVKFEKTLIAASVEEGRTREAFLCCGRMLRVRPHRAVRGAIRVVRLTWKNRRRRRRAVVRRDSASRISRAA